MVMNELTNPGARDRRAMRTLRTTGFAASAVHAPVSTIMTTNVACVRADMSIEDLLAFFLDRGLNSAPVVDDDSALVGFVSLSDLVCERAAHGDTEEIALRVGLPAGGGYNLGSGFHAQPTARMVTDIMTRPAICLQPAATVTMAAALMAFEGVQQLPIVDAEQQVVGVLFALDVLRWVGQQDGYSIPGYTQRKSKSVCAP